MRTAQRMNLLGTETAFEVLAKAQALEAQGRKIIHLEIGEPDFNTPSNIRMAAKRALDDGYTHYGPAPGLPEFRRVIAEHMTKKLGVEFTDRQVMVTPGGKPIMFFSILALVDPGEEVIYPNPGFPIYESIISFVGAKPVPLALLEERDFRFDIDELRRLITKRTRMLIINSPQNPTGGILTRDDLRQISELAVEHDLIVLSDEIYSRIIYDGFQHASIIQFDGMRERTIVLDGFSKTYAMTGWRLGYGLMPEALLSLISQLQINSNSCTASFTQVAGIEALNGSQEEAYSMVTEFKHRRDVIVDGLNKIPGFSCKKPLGAFYVFPNIRGTGMPSRVLAEHILNEADVACLSGTAFGDFGEGYLRFSYANSVENIQIALQRIGKLVARL